MKLLWPVHTLKQALTPGHSVAKQNVDVVFKE